MNIKTIFELIEKEIELYSKILMQNQSLMDSDENIEPDYLNQKIYNKEKLLEEIKKIDNLLNDFWINWENFKNQCSKEDKNTIKKLKEVIEQNLSIEEVLIKKFKNLLSKQKTKTLNVNKSRNVFNAYKSRKTNIPYFINKKS